MKKFLRRLVRFGKFIIYVTLGLCVAWTLITFPGLYKIANDPEARAEHIQMLENITDEEVLEGSSQEAMFAASSAPPSNQYISLGTSRPMINFKLDQLVYVKTATHKKHYVEIMGKSGTVETIYGSVTEVQKQISLESLDYFSARGLLLNLNYVDQVHCQSAPPEGKSHFKIHVNDGCGAAYEVRIKPNAIPSFRKQWKNFCQKRGWI